MSDMSNKNSKNNEEYERMILYSFIVLAFAAHVTVKEPFLGDLLDHLYGSNALEAMLN